ncbi:hypothetical protein GCM10011579_094110 [Streptomyces albiflavescens]|uniref:Phage tail protein n=1 Tax=Streptomyces albiflavescens TaxID=1623582 RepID=A0A917YF28_9ACTN|nr:phage tail protein [Streptomyces albiflavescens]GGN94529.1 hypothetical protein GCM10011579_094110 [Streptomyces albiflavescens]
MPEPPAYRYLNREGRWLGMDRSGLALGPDGGLRLESLPAVDGPLPPEDGDASPVLPAGVAALPHGDVFFTQPAEHRLLFVRACDPERRAAVCLSGPGSGSAELHTPQGVLHHPRRHALLIADSGNGRILLLDLRTLQPLDIWGSFASPTSLAAGPAGEVYVVDAGRIRARDPWGRPLVGFRHTVPAEPAEIAVADSGGQPVIFVLDSGGRVHVLAADGSPLRDWATELEQPMGLAVAGTTVYLGDNGDRRLHVFDTDGHRVGAAYGYTRPVAALATDHHDGLLAHTGGPVPPVRLHRHGAYRTSGVLRGGPYRNPSSRGAPLHLVRSQITNSGTGAHFQLHVCTRTDGRAPDDSAGPFTDPGWRAVAYDAPYTLLAGSPTDDLWIGMSFGGNGQATPVLSQIRIDFAHDSYLRHLPELYRQPAMEGDFLARWLTVFESAFDDMHRGIEALPTLFDPAAAPAAHLARLADWLAVTLPADADEPQQRRILCDAATADARRGTPAGLRAAIRARAGVEAVIEEPVVQTNWWVLPGGSSSDAGVPAARLGLDTVLAAAEAQGAVVGSTAVLEGSVLAPQDAYATHLFADVAHRFTVRVRPGPGFGEHTVDAVRAVIDEEKPAHTTYHLCTIEPRMRLGIQDRLGVDTVVAGPPPATPLDSPGTSALRLGGPPPARVGAGAAVGTTRLAGGPPPGHEGGTR